LDKCKSYKLTSALKTDFINHIQPKRGEKTTTHEGIPMDEWQGCLALAPEDVIQKTLEITTQCYMTVTCENRTNVKDDYKGCFRGLRLPRLNEGVATDTFFPLVCTAHGHKCSKMFTGMFLNRWHAHGMKKESHNGITLQNFSRIEGLFYSSSLTIHRVKLETSGRHTAANIVSRPRHQNLDTHGKIRMKRR